MQEHADKAPGSILVSIRVRPLSQKEQSLGDLDIVRVEDKLLVLLDMTDFEDRKSILHRSKEQRYVFDLLFKDKTNEEVYQHTAAGLIKPALSGINACAFAYGPTGSGKTYTMVGTPEDPGISVLTVRDMFQQIQNDSEKVYDIKISYVEIYNETIRDLLIPNSGYLELRDDPQKGVVISGVTEYKAESTDQVMQLISAGNRRRTTEATNANLTSSRSHAIFQAVVSIQDRTKSTVMDVYTGKLSLIDLAGSERGTVTENRGIRLWEGAKINRSLLALANCINALGDKSKKGFFVPFRDSKLTRMLKDSLGGNCQTVMIANISPAASQFEETANTLKYASRAKNIKVKVLANKKMVALHISEYKNIISDLRNEIDVLKTQLHRNVGGGPVQQPAESGDCVCMCGRKQDEIEVKRLQAEIFENFQERIQLRRALIELEEQNDLNFLEIRKKQAEVMLWKKQEVGNAPPAEIDPARPKSAVPPQIRNVFKDIQTLKVNTDRNNQRKELMLGQLHENMQRGKAIRESLSTSIRFQDKREFLELLIKNHILEQTNVELEIQLQIQEKTINDLQNLLQAQKKLLEEHHIDDGSELLGGLDQMISPHEMPDAEEVNEEELEKQGYDINEPVDEEDEEQPFDGDEDFETSDYLLATSKVGEDIEKHEEPSGFMLQGRGLIKRPEEAKRGPESKEEESKQRSEAQQFSQVQSMGLMINGRAMDDGLAKKALAQAPKAVKPAKKKGGAEVFRKKK